MKNATDPAVLAECVGQLDDEDGRAVRRYWYRVVREVAAEPVVVPVGYPVPFAADVRRERRETRRAFARIVAAGRRPVVTLAEVRGWDGTSDPVPAHYCPRCGSAILNGYCSNAACPSYVDARFGEAA